jgi:SAM-dependent methyltransferase
MQPADPRSASDGRTYHELDDAPTLLAHVRRALRPGGRLVVVDRGPRLHEGLGPNEHELAPSEADGLRGAHFEILERHDAFIDRAGDPDLWWLIVARRRP